MEGCPTKHFLPLGMPTLLEMPRIEDCLSLCRQWDLDFLELNSNLPQYQPETLDCDWLLRLKEQYGVWYTIHLDENLDPCNFNRAIARAWTQTALDTLAAARRLGAPVINMHLNRGVYFTLPERKVFLYQQERGRYLEDLREFRDRAEQAAGPDGPLICVENTGGYIPDIFLEGLDLLLESPAFALTYDTGHDAAIEKRDWPSILARKDRLVHMHLHDCLEKRDHLPLGAGGLDIPQMVDLAKACRCRVVLETKTVAGLRQSLDWINAYEKNLFD